MEVSIICSSFIYSERHEERVSGVGGGGEGGRVQKCILKYFSLVSEEKMEAVTIPIKKKNTFKPMSSEKRRQSCSAIDRRLNKSRPERKADGR